MSAAEKAQPVMKAIQDTLTELDATARLVSEFYDDGHGTAKKEMFQHVNDLIGHFEKVDGLRTELEGLRVPVDFLDHIDQLENSNPDLYTRYKANYLLEEKERKRRVAKDMQTIKEEILQEVAKGLDIPPTTQTMEAELTPAGVGDASATQDETAGAP
mmetsp:Transcript_553/g.1412  ORF Transcript_553/g.1412 Transcript_553/m.1412 type:complete len:158 (+) Transcript_553:300-773(+)|eukprot:CAMPEP_0171502156 /NCGR_PEP_ID=MMETSP0958-20121227/10005_1 /TAXON_ID=87120 /ORGANISM="Aurantiochytrium limacinum, Strain ATCCMYA-1381" /LENGTH=157 /DNA_ID=CAMNT_0012037147 /DNA_START=199 /DNA_END=672 /DNA_ORIENTATION=+